jgi:hypothetical protein
MKSVSVKLQQLSDRTSKAMFLLSIQNFDRYESNSRQIHCYFINTLIADVENADP